MPGGEREPAGPLIGRDADKSLLTSLLDEIQSRGQALVVRGEPGIGKSRLLIEAAAVARERGIAVLSAIGVQSEANLPFSGLHQLLRPVRARASELTAVQRSALDAAFGLTDEAAPEHFRIGMAALDLLSEVATDAPLLVVVEDVQWLDRPTSDVLAFIARRLESDPIVLLAAARDGYPSALVDSGLPEHRVRALDDATAGALLDASAPGLTLAERNRLLREAAGNPLALIELPVAARRQQMSPRPDGLPLTERLEQAFAARVSDLADATRLLLLVAALSDGDRVSEILEAGSAVAGRALDLDLLEPAAGAAIVNLDLHTVHFRHPLIRSAVGQSASLPDRRRVHEALAEALKAELDRRAWHRAALMIGEHEDVARELEDAAARARRRGAITVEVTALQRAGELSDPAHRGRRLLSAGELAVELGQPELAAPLLREVDEQSGPVERALATWIEEMISPPDLGDAMRVARVVDAAERAGDAGDRGLHVRLLWLAISRAWWTDPGPAARRVLVDAARRPGGPGHRDPRVLAIYACADPVGHAAEALPRLEAMAATRTLDSESVRHLGPAALVVGAFDIAVGYSRPPPTGRERRDGWATCPGCSFSTAWDVAVPAGEEARRLATELGGPLWIAGGETVLSLVAGMRGDADAAERGAARAEQLGLAAGGKVTVALAQFGRVLSALGASRHEDAYASARRLFDPADPAYHRVVARWLIADLAEAALHTDRVAEGRELLAQVETTVGARPAVWIELNLRHARALLARDEAGAKRCFDDALAANLGCWPFQRARLLLAYGEWLRRQRRIAIPRAAAHRTRHLRHARLHVVERPRSTRAPCLRGVEPASRSGSPRSADRPRASNRPARRAGPIQPRGRPAALPLPPDDQHTPVPGLPQARHHHAQRARCGSLGNHGGTPIPKVNVDDVPHGCPLRSALAR
jgi:AAA ATPase domain